VQKYILLNKKALGAEENLKHSGRAEQSTNHKCVCISGL
jgi:hypothetical protein